jgi:hypothetical protein
VVALAISPVPMNVPKRQGSKSSPSVGRGRCDRLAGYGLPDHGLNNTEKRCTNIDAFGAD